MADDAPRAALARRSRSDLAGLIADAWTDRGWTVSGGETAGADLVATREGAYTERLAILVAEPGSTVGVETVQRAAGIREQESTDVVLVVGTADVTDAATTLARQEALNVKVLDGWGLCRVLENQGLLGRIDGAGPENGGDEEPATPTGEQRDQVSTPGTGASQGPQPSGETGPATGGGQGAVGSQSDANAATEMPSEGDPQDAGVEDAHERGAPQEKVDTGTTSATETETPCPSCGEAIFQPLIEQGLECPYCDADFA